MIGAGIDIGRDPARGLAERELARPAYHRDDPSLFVRASTWLHNRIDHLLHTVSGVVPGGWLGRLVLVALVALLVVAIVVRVGGVRRSGRRADPLLFGRLRSADEYRTDAERALAEGKYDVAVRDRLRALARDLEMRGLLEPRPGRTADELGAEAGRAMPELAAALRDAARVFDDIWYGGRPATPELYALVRRVDEQVSSTRVVLGAAP